MKKTSAEQYQAWVKEVEAGLEEDQKVHFQALVNSEAGQKVFGGHLREADYYKRLNEHNAERQKFEQEKTQMYSWYEQEAPKVERTLKEKQNLERRLQEYERQLAEQGFIDESTTPAVHADMVKREELEAIRQENQRRLQMFDQALPALLGDIGDVMYRSLSEGYKVNPKEVIKYALENRVDPNRAFEALTADEREARSAKRQEEDLKKAREEGRREAMSKFPTPDVHRPSGPSVVSNLQDPNFKPLSQRDRVNDAVKEFLASGGQ
jgi:hypothetical protein